MTSRRKIWLGSVLLYALFVSWYTDFGGPLTEAEIQAYIAKTENLDLGGDPSARGALLAAMGTRLNAARHVPFWTSCSTV